jgi:hypothetical protein
MGEELPAIPEIPEGELRSAVDCLVQVATMFHDICEMMPEYQAAVNSDTEYGVEFRRCEEILEKWQEHTGYTLEDEVDVKTILRIVGGNR